MQFVSCSRDRMHLWSYPYFTWGFKHTVHNLCKYSYWVLGEMVIVVLGHSFVANVVLLIDESDGDHRWFMENIAVVNRLIFLSKDDFFIVMSFVLQVPVIFEYLHEQHTKKKMSLHKLAIYCANELFFG